MVMDASSDEPVSDPFHYLFLIFSTGKAQCIHAAENSIRPSIEHGQLAVNISLFVLWLEIDQIVRCVSDDASAILVFRNVEQLL